MVCTGASSEPGTNGTGTRYWLSVYMRIQYGTHPTFAVVKHLYFPGRFRAPPSKVKPKLN